MVDSGVGKKPTRRTALAKRKTARASSPPALLVGTSTEYIGRRPLPRVLRSRPFILILGPLGVGKTTVALRVLGGDALILQGEALHTAAVRAVRRKRWTGELLGAPALIIDGPTYLGRRPGATRLLLELIRARADQGLRTIVCQGQGDDSAALLADALEPELRATLTLRFPIGRGRQRFQVRMAQRMGLEPAVGRRLVVEEPWTYERVLAALRDGAGEPE